MNHRQKEFMVGCLVIGVVLLMGIFAWLMGVFQPFSNNLEVNVLYRFAGGIEAGSPVRVAGIKVGQVRNIEFVPLQTEDGGDVPLKVTLSISKKAAVTVREDSKFYINMAGIIGEKYVEITPGSSTSPAIPNGGMVRGIDPPRIDQLLSQGYGVFGRIQELLEGNQEAVADLLGELPKVMKGITQFIRKNNWKKMLLLIDNLNLVTTDIRVLTKKFHEQPAQQVLDKLYDMVDRAYEIDKESLKQFLQEEGIRARIF